MKSICVLITYFFFLPVVSAQEFMTYYKGQKQKYAISKNRLIIKYAEPTTIGKTEQSLWKEKLNKIGHGTDMKLHIVTLDSEMSQEKITNIVKEIDSDEMVAYASPVLLTESGDEVGGLTNRFIVRLKPSSSKIDFEKMVDNKSLKAKPYEFDDRTFIVSVAKGFKENSMELANRFYESGMFEFSEPDLLLFVHGDTNDPYFGSQWSLTAFDDQGGMSVTSAWNMTSGCSSVKIAILDNGVELAHPDLVNNLVQGFDATGGGSNGGPDSGSPHGTACAGIAGATANNGIGVAGVAYNCKLIPIRFYTALVDDPNSATEASWAASAIDWAWQNGASVISMSVHLSIGQSSIDAAINRAFTQGRSNLGCVLLAASGNHQFANGNTSVLYPASNGQVIAVGGSVAGGGRNGTSNFGTGLDIVAPGANIYTTDQMGGLGYVQLNGAAGDYNPSFDGTSAACPNAAGVMGLILSVNPNLTSSQARQILETTTDKKSTLTFAAVSGQPNGTWNEEVGYGSVNAYKAISSMLGGPISSPYFLCGGETYTLTSPPMGTSVVWSSGAGISINSSTGTVSRINNFTGTSTITATIYGACGPIYSTSRNIWAGTPYFNSISIDGGSGPYPLCNSGIISYTANQDHVIHPVVSGQSSSSVSYALNGPAGVVSGAPLSATDYDFISQSSSASFTITASADNGCGTTSQCLSFSNGACSSISSVTINGSTWTSDCQSNYFPFSAGTWYTITVATNPTGLPVLFYVNDYYVISQTLSSNQFRVKCTNASESFAVNASVSGSCGPGQCIWFSNSGSGVPTAAIRQTISLSAYPNPVSNVLHVKVVDSLSSSITLNQVYQLKLINKFSQTVYSLQTSDKNVEIPVDNLPADIYYLNLFYGNAVLREQIVIKK